MNEIGTFDILGPNMIGPSSSHTAGALRIAFIAGKNGGEAGGGALCALRILRPYLTWTRNQTVH